MRITGEANSLAPGRIDTDRVRQIDNDQAKRRGLSPQDVEREAIAAIPSRRWTAVRAGCRKRFETLLVDDQGDVAPPAVSRRELPSSPAEAHHPRVRIARE